jgi:hypothetical protein
MKKFVFSIVMTALVGNPFVQGHFLSPTGETVFWKWFDKELGVLDSNGQCVWNSGEPRDCTPAEISKLLYYFEGG